VADKDGGGGELPEWYPPELRRPVLSIGDKFVLAWYGRNCTGFARDFNLMPMLIRRMNLRPENEELFLMKLNTIHRTLGEIEDDKREASREK